jgi:hypothetical protein
MDTKQLLGNTFMNPDDKEIKNDVRVRLKRKANVHHTDTSMYVAWETETRKSNELLRDN